MRVFRQLVVGGAISAIALGNMGEAIAAPPPANSPDTSAENNPRELEADAQLDSINSSEITPQISLDEADNPESGSFSESQKSENGSSYGRNALERWRSLQVEMKEDIDEDEEEETPELNSKEPEQSQKQEPAQTKFSSTLQESLQSQEVAQSDRLLPTDTGFLEVKTDTGPTPRMPAVRELADPETETAELAGDNTNLAQETTPNLNPREDFPQPLPNGTLETLPPPILEPSLNPLDVPINPDAVQIDETIAITLEQAVDLARRYSPDLEVARLQLEQSQALFQEARAALFPNVSFQSQLQRQISAQGELQLRAANRQAEILGQEPPDLTNFGSITFNNTFRLTYDTGIDGARSARIAAAGEQVKLQQLEFERIAEDLRLQITAGYYNLQEADGRVRVGEAAVSNAEKSLRDAEALERAGVGTRFDVLQAQVTLANEEQNLTNALRDQRVSRRRLVEQLNVNESIQLAAADEIQPAGTWQLSLDETIIAAFKNRAELEQELVQRDLSEEQRQIALSAIRPSLDLFANYNVLGLITDDVDPGATRGWADGYSLGATFTWTFFDGRAAKARAKQNELDIALAETRFDRLINQIRREVEEGFFELQASFDNISTAELGLEQAREAFRLARLRFQAGVGTQLEVINSQTDLTRAELNLLVAILNYNRALSALQRSVSNLPDGDLSDAP